MGNYHWTTYEEVNRKVNDIAKGYHTILNFRVNHHILNPVRAHGNWNVSS